MNYILQSKAGGSRNRLNIYIFYFTYNLRSFSNYNRIYWIKKNRDILSKSLSAIRIGHAFKCHSFFGYDTCQPQTTVNTVNTCTSVERRTLWRYSIQLFEYPILIIKITISLIVIGLKISYFPLIHLPSCYRTVCYRTPCYRTVQ